MSLDAYGHKQTNQILDFDERHCINEYKSAYVLRCRSTNWTFPTKSSLFMIRSLAKQTSIVYCLPLL